MKTLEGMARELFNRYAARVGVEANWNYLSDDRKLVWMKDVMLLADYFMENLKLEMKPIPTNGKSNTVYEAGFNDGVKSERTSFTVLIEELHGKLLDEYQDFQYSVDESSDNT